MQQVIQNGTITAFTDDSAIVAMREEREEVTKILQKARDHIND